VRVWLVRHPTVAWRVTVLLRKDRRSTFSPSTHRDGPRQARGNVNSAERRRGLDERQHRLAPLLLPKIHESLCLLLMHAAVGDLYPKTRFYWSTMILGVVNIGRNLPGEPHCSGGTAQQRSVYSGTLTYSVSSKRGGLFQRRYNSQSAWSVAVADPTSGRGYGPAVAALFLGQTKLSTVSKETLTSFEEHKTINGGCLSLSLPSIKHFTVLLPRSADPKEI
jgi:hypothetical protein